ncbi:MAB_1171c family putative transporter [Micromonospora sp. NPDC049366]|uniref:MAB_1171c family putative transporter n=1 Tax=Micromonospora sp. NPDC049366 TaxID=3364271 RepID=UPI0037934978
MIFVVLVASAALCAGIYTVYTLRGGNRVPSRTWMGVALLCLALALGVLTPDIRSGVDALLGVPNVARLIAHALTMWAATAALCMLVYWTHTPQSTRKAVHGRQVIAVAATAVMAALFVIARAPATNEEFFSTYAHRWPIALYMIVFGLMLTYTLVDLARLSLRYGRRITNRPVTRLGLRLFAAGGLVALGYSLTIIAVACLEFFGVDFDWDWTRFSSICQLLGIGLIVIGSVLPGTANASTAALHRAQDAHQCELMEPLWRAIVQTHPEIPRRRPRSRNFWGRWTAWTASWMGDGRSVSRRVLEIRDGYLQLTPWFDSHVTNRAIELGRKAGLSGSELQAVVEAAVVAVALDAKARGEDRVDTGDVEPGAENLTGEVKWLVRVAQAFDHSPVVTQILAERQRAHEEGRSWVERTLDDLGFGRDNK